MDGGDRAMPLLRLEVSNMIEETEEWCFWFEAVFPGKGRARVLRPDLPSYRALALELGYRPYKVGPKSRSIVANNEARGIFFSPERVVADIAKLRQIVIDQSIDQSIGHFKWVSLEDLIPV